MTNTKEPIDYVNVVLNRLCKENESLKRELDSAKAIIQRQAELISYLIKDKNLAEIKARFDAEIADKEIKNS